jgi:hypothetical protein
VVVRNGAVRLSGFSSIVVADAVLILRRYTEQDCSVESLHTLLDRVGVDFVFYLHMGQFDSEFIEDDLEDIVGDRLAQIALVLKERFEEHILRRFY